MGSDRWAYFLGLALAASAGCSGSQGMLQTETHQANPVADEPETAPTVATPSRFLDIQRQVIRLRRGIRINFATNSDELLPESHPVLDEVASVMQQNARIRIRVEGHTDDVGSDADNMALSGRRATSVQNYLTAHGVAGDRVESTGCGESAPLVENSNDENRQQNRRVEFVILRRRRVVERCQVYHPGEGGQGGAPTATPTTAAP